MTDTNEAKLSTNEAGRPLKDLARDGAKEALAEADNCTNVGMAHVECVAVTDHIEAYGVACMKAMAQRLKAAIVAHAVGVKGACCWNRPATCDIEIKKLIDKEISDLRASESRD